MFFGLVKFDVEQLQRINCVPKHRTMRASAIHFFLGSVLGVSFLFIYRILQMQNQKQAFLSSFLVIHNSYLELSASPVKLEQKITSIPFQLE